MAPQCSNHHGGVTCHLCVEAVNQERLNKALNAVCAWADEPLRILVAEVSVLRAMLVTGTWTEATYWENVVKQLRTSDDNTLEYARCLREKKP